MQVDFAPPADYVEPPPRESLPAQSARPAAPAIPAASEPNLEHDSSEDDEAATPKFVGSGKRLDGKSSSAKQRKLPAAASPEGAAGPANGAGSADAAPPAPKFQGASGTLSGKPVDVEPELRADPASQAAAGADKFGPAIARTAELRRAAEEREKRAAQAGKPPQPAPEPGTDEYWASLGGGNKLK